MTFVQPEFPVLLLTVFAVYWLLPSRTAQNLLLLGASVVFYGWIHPWFVGLLGFTALLDYVVALAIVRFPERKRWALVVSLVGNLGTLGVFKYYDFFVENVASALTSIGLVPHLSTLNLLLPAGISFYTFQTLSYTIDVYRGQLRPRTNFVEYFLYVTFFPQLVAGPIERAGNFLPQIERARVWSSERVLSGASLALWGAFKKVCIADVIGPYVDRLHLLEDLSTPLVIAATVGFGVQIMADFSGYTDIARGVARMFGFELSLNFDRPFLATTTPEFWRRWHISLGTWIGDYVFGPLSRVTGSGPLRLAAATLITFFLIGLWHGAAWHFVVQGLWFGTWMVLYTMLGPLVPARVRAIPGGRWLAIAFHLVVVMIPAGMLFREVSVARAVQHLTQNPFVYTHDELLVAWVVLSIALVLALPMVLAVVAEDKVLPLVRRTPWFFPLQTATSTLLAVLVLTFHRDSGYDFIYFQF